MTSTNLPAQVSTRTNTTAGSLLQLDEPQFTETLPLMMVSALERRYLTGLQAGQWNIAAREGDESRPLLREVVKLGRPDASDSWAKAMPHVLTACHEPGHALVMALHGEGARHRLFLGGRRLLGTGARSTEDFVEAQESAFKAFFTGLEMGPTTCMDSNDMPEMAEFLQTAPALAVLTGIPSGRGGKYPVALQSLDRLVKAVGNQKYLLLVVSEPVEPWVIDSTLDACRRMKSAVHAYTRRTITRSQGESEGESHSDREEKKDWQSNLPVALFGLGAFCSVVGLFNPILGRVAQSMISMGQTSSQRQMQKEMRESKQLSTGKNWSEAGGTELLDANAEACEQLLQEHIERIQAGRSNGWWKTAIYVAAESEAAIQSVTGAVRSLCSGDSTSLDPFRSIPVPQYMLRNAIEYGQVLSLLPGSGQGHPLGESFDVLGTCVTSEELSVLVNLPQAEIPGLPMHDMSDFALSAPEATEDSILLGRLQDSLGRDLSPVTVTQAALNRHVFVSGITGYGKTNTCMQILLETWSKLQVPFMVLEPAKAEYRRLAQTEEFKGQIRVYTLGGNSPLPFRLNPLSPVPGVPLGRHIDLLKAVFNASFPMYAGMPYVLEEAILEVYSERGWSLFTSENAYLGARPSMDELSALTPCLEDLHDKVEVVLKRKSYGQEIHANMGAALRSRIHSLMVGNKGLALNTRRSTPLSDLFDSPTVIELQNLGDDEEKAFVMALLFVLLYEYAEVRQHDVAPSKRGKLQHMTLIEEAHRLLQKAGGPVSAESADPRSKAVSMFTDMLAEMRAYGEGFIIADQIPTKLAPETLKNSNLKILHRLVSPDDREAAGSCVNLTEWQKRHLNNLRPGIAIVHDEHIGEAVLTRIQPVKDNRAPNITDREARTLLAEIEGKDKAYLYRHAGCRSCPAPCTFFHRLEEAVDQSEWNRRLQPFLESVFLDDAATAWEVWSRWRGEWARSQAMMNQRGPAAEGVTFCAVVNAAHKWLGSMQGNRDKMEAHATSPLSAEQRLQREVAVRALGELFLTWTRKTECDDEAKARFEKTQAKVWETVAQTPPRDLPGCDQCPARCRMPAFVVPIKENLEKQIKPKLIGTMSGADRLRAIELAVGQIESSMSMLKQRKDNPSIHRQWLYCALAHIELASDVPASVEAGREAVQSLLRGPIVDAELAELSDIAGFPSGSGS